MRRLTKSLCLALTATILLATDPGWRNKPADQWTEEDARQVLAKSPWARDFEAVITRRLTEEQLRDGGRMGQPRGIGNEGVDAKESGPKMPENVFSGSGGDDRSIRSRPQPIILKIRWENALPVRLAELKSHEPDPPTLEADGYRLAVYGIPNAAISGDPERLGVPLRNLSALKRQGKKDVKPLRVEVFQLENVLEIVYLFPLSAEITRQDRLVRFDAQIGRIVLSQTFDLSLMDFMGKLEL